MRTLCIAAMLLGLSLTNQASADEAKALALLQEMNAILERSINRPGQPLTAVGFNKKPATDDALAVLSAFPELETVALYESKATAKGIASLKKVAKLQSLHLGTKIALTDDILDAINELSGLPTLSIWSESITNDSLARLKSLTGLRNLSLPNTPIDDRALVHIKHMKELRTLNLHNVGSNKDGRAYRITDVGLEHIKGLTKLEVLLVPNCYITGKGMAHLKDMPELRELNVFNTGFDDAGLELLKNHTKLEVLSLSATRVTGDGLVHIAGLKKLRELDMSTCTLNDKSMVHLKDLVELQRLYIGSAGVGEAGMVHLKGLTKLTHIHLGGNTDAGIAHLANCKDMRHFTASGPGITDASLVHFKGMRQLSMLYLYNTRITEAGLADLKKSLPSVGVYLK